MNEYKLTNVLKQKTFDIHVDTAVLNEGFAVHTHDYCELVFIASGKGTHIVGDTKYDLHAGDVFVIKGSERHGFEAMENVRLYNIMFNVYDLQADDCRNLTGFWALFIHEQTSQFISHIALNGRDRELMLDLCGRMVEEYTLQQPGCRALCRSLLTQIIVLLSRLCQESAYGSDQVDFRLAKSVVYMQTNFSNRITVEDLAETVGYSKRHFDRLFRQAYGMTPMQFLNEIRINHAKMLLETGRCKVAEAAAACGFQDGNYFSRVFSQKAGCAPSEWGRN